VLKTGFGYTGAIDGVFRPAHRGPAVRLYQANSGVPVTGSRGTSARGMAPAGGRRSDAREACRVSFSEPIHFAKRRGPSAGAAFILQGVDDIPGLRARQTPSTLRFEVLLQPFRHRRFGLGAKASIDAAGIEADRAPSYSAGGGRGGRLPPPFSTGWLWSASSMFSPRHQAHHPIDRDFPAPAEMP